MFPMLMFLFEQFRLQAPVQVFLCAHMDTVFPSDHPFQTITQLEDDIINGPGVADLKGGIVVMFKALEAFERSPLQDQLGWEILFNPDEEVGSPSSSKLRLVRTWFCASASASLRVQIVRFLLQTCSVIRTNSILSLSWCACG